MVYNIAMSLILIKDKVKKEIKRIKAEIKFNKNRSSISRADNILTEGLLLRSG